jgi:hypothetical protein
MGISSQAPGLWLTTKLYDRHNEETSLDEYERIGI